MDQLRTDRPKVQASAPTHLLTPAKSRSVLVAWPKRPSSVGVFVKSGLGQPVRLDDQVQRLTDHWFPLDASRIGASGQTESRRYIVSRLIILGTLDQTD